VSHLPDAVKKGATNRSRKSKAGRVEGRSSTSTICLFAAGLALSVAATPLLVSDDKLRPVSSRYVDEFACTDSDVVNAKSRLCDFYDKEERLAHSLLQYRVEGGEPEYFCTNKGAVDYCTSVNSFLPYTEPAAMPSERV